MRFCPAKRHFGALHPLLESSSEVVHFCPLPLSGIQRSACKKASAAVRSFAVLLCPTWHRPVSGATVDVGPHVLRSSEQQEVQHVPCHQISLRDDDIVPRARYQQGLDMGHEGLDALEGASRVRRCSVRPTEDT